MFKQTSIGKAFQINKDSNIYGTFAEIGAGQETVNFFYHAGLASQTVAKSMSAYDMTVSDEIYGKQNRYVCKSRVLNMLNHEYRLLDKRLKNKLGNKTRFFVFATTAATRSKKAGSVSFSNQHAWMGLRFQAQPKGKLNDVIFHVSCLDKNRLQQHEALGILGLNLIYASFYHRQNPKEFIKSLTENLSGNRLEIHGMTCSGPAFKNFPAHVLNLEILSQQLSSLAFFPNFKASEFLSDTIFNKSPVIFCGSSLAFKQFKKNKAKALKLLKLTEKNSHIMQFMAKENLKAKQFKNYNFPLLISQKPYLDQLKKFIFLHSSKPVFFVVDEDFLTKKLFKVDSYQTKYFLKALGAMFDNHTKIAVIPKNKNFNLKDWKLAKNQTLKDYLVKQNQILLLK